MEKQTNNSKGGQLGNKNATKKPFTEMFKRHLKANPKKLEKIISKLVDEAAEGNLAAAKEIMDRVEGKSIQAMDVTSSDGTMSQNLTVNYINPLKDES